MAKHPTKYWLIVAGLWATLIILMVVGSLIFTVDIAFVLYALASLIPVCWLFHTLAKHYSRGLIPKRTYDKAKAIITDMERVDMTTLAISLDLTYEDTCLLLDMMEEEDFLTPRRLKFPNSLDDYQG